MATEKTREEEERLTWLVTLWDHCHELLDEKEVLEDIELLLKRENVKKGTLYSALTVGFVLGYWQFGRLYTALEKEKAVTETE